MKWDETRTNFDRNLAVIIGIDHYNSQTIHSLSTAVNDADRFADLLHQDYGYAEENIIRLFSPRPDGTSDRLSQPYCPATLDELNILLDETLPHKLKPTRADRLLLYFAGHGIAENGENGPAGYLIPQTAAVGNPKTYLSMQRLSQALNALECHHLLVVLDCCFGGAFRWASTRKLVADLEVIHKENYDRFIRFPAWQVITSAAHDQEALDLSVDRRVAPEGQTHSPFAQALFEGLQQNKADLISDRVITAHELYLYLNDRVSLLSDHRQTPGIYPIRRDYDKGEYIFTRPDFSRDILKAAPPLDKENNPYRGLKPFEERHARFFFGRTALRKELLDRLNRPTTTRLEDLREALPVKPVPPLTIVLGGSGSGKSSLVQAGLLPDLRQKQPDQWYILDPFRPGDAPFTALARAILPIVKPDLFQQLQQPDFLDQRLQAFLPAAAEEITADSSAEQRQKASLSQLAKSWNSVTLEARLLIVTDYFIQLQPLFDDTQAQTFAAFSLALHKALQQITSDLQNPQYLAQAIAIWSQQPGQASRKLLMVIDQFEELVTLSQTDKAQLKAPSNTGSFLEAIRLALSEHSQQLRVILTLRSDFEPRFLNSPLQDWWQYARFPVRPMNSDELREAIEAPAQLQALYFEPADLVGTLTDEVGQMPGALPLLSFTLSELYSELAEKWRRQEVSDRALRLEDYNRLGGVAGSLSKRATEEYDRWLSPETGEEIGKAYQTTMQRVMLRMVTIEGGSVARRRVTESELNYPTDAANQRVKAVVDRLVTARLLVRGQEAGVSYVEPAHDFLVRGWDKLQRWLKEEQETLTLQQRLIPAAQDWNTRKQNEPTRWQDQVWGWSDRTLFRTVESVQVKKRRALQRKQFKLTQARLQASCENSEDYLWDEDPRLEQLNRLVGSPNSWFNQTEDLFVRESVVQKEKNWLIKLLFGMAASAIACGLLGLMLLSQKDRLLEQVRASRESAEANLQADRQLEALIETLRAGKTLNDPLNLLNPFLWAPPAETEAQVKETLFKTLAHVRERNRLQLNRAAIYTVVVSPSGEELATTEDDDTVRLWDTSGKQIDQFPTGQGVVKSLAFSSDGKQLATGGEDGTILIWRIKDRKIDLTQKPIDILKASKGDLPEGAILSLAFSQTAPQLAIVDSNLTVWLWNLNLNRLDAANSKLRDKSRSNIYEVAFNPDRNEIATVGDDDLVELWDTISGEKIDQFNTGQEIVYSVSFRDGDRLATGGTGNKVELWSIQRQRRRVSFTATPEEITTEQASTYSLSFGQNGLLATIGNDETVTIHGGAPNLLGNPKIQPAKGNRQNVEVQSLAFSPNGRSLATVSTDNQLRVWDLTGSQIGRFQVSGKAVGSVAFSPDGELIATGAADGTIELRDPKGNFLDRALLELQDTQITSIVFDSTGQQLAAIAESGAVQWLILEDQTFKKFEDRAIVEQFQAPIDGIRNLAFAPNQRQIAVLQTNGTVSLWDYASRQHLQTLPRTSKRINGITFSPNGRLLATAHTDSTVRLWQVQQDATGKISKIHRPSVPFATQQGGIQNIAFNRVNSNLLVTSGKDGTARLWDLSTGQPPQTFLPSHLSEKDSGAIAQAVFSPNAQKLATLRSNNLLELWQVVDRRLIQLQPHVDLNSVPGFPSSVKSLVFSPNNRLLAVTGQNETIHFWDTDSKQWLNPISMPAHHKITSLVFSPDNQKLAILAQDLDQKGTLFVYRRTSDWSNRQSNISSFELQPVSAELDEMDISSIAFSPQGDQLATARATEGKGIVTVWDSAIATKGSEFKTQHRITSLAFNQDHQLATFEADGVAKLWDLQAGKQEVGEFKISEPQIDPEPNLSLPMGFSSLSAPKPALDSPENPPETPQAIEAQAGQHLFSPDGRLLAVVSQGKLKLWNVLGDSLNSLQAQHQTAPVLNAAFDSQSKRLVTIAQDGRLSFWQVGDVEDLLATSCTLLQNYLNNNPNVSSSDRTLCSDAPPSSAHDNISGGEKLLISRITHPEKQAGVEAMAMGDWMAATQHFQNALKVNLNDPETRIYLNNAQIRNQPAHTIAVAAPISSDVAGAQEMLRGVAQAQYQVNQAGGINSVPLRVIIADDQGMEEVQQTAEALVENTDVLGVVGHFSSDSTLAAAEVYSQHQLVAISPVSTATQLSNFGRYFFRTVPSDRQAAQKLADYMLNSTNLHHAAVFYSSRSKYSSSLKAEFETALQSQSRLPGSITSKFDLSSASFDAKASVRQAVQDGAEAIVLLANTEELNDALAVIKANSNHLPLLAGDDLYTLKTLQTGRENAIGMVVAVPWTINWAIDNASSGFVATSNQLWRARVNWRTAMSYDATIALVDAIRQSGQPTREQIATILRSQNFSVQGASGKVTFADSGDRSSAEPSSPGLVQVVRSPHHSFSGTGYDFEPTSEPSNKPATPF